MYKMVHLLSSMEAENFSQALYDPCIWAVFRFNILKRSFQWEVGTLLG
jgi:hypothetical protein